MLSRSILGVLIALACTSAAYAATASKDPFPLSAKSTEEFREQASTLRAAMEKGEFSDLSAGDRNAIDKLLVELDALYVRRSASGERAESVETAAINANSEINALLTGNNGEKLVCEQVKRVGSNRSTKVCATVAERDARRREAQKFILDRDVPSVYEGPDGLSDSVSGGRAQQ